MSKGIVRWSCGRFSDSPFFAFFEFSNCCADDPDLDRPCTNPSHKKMRLAEPATVSNFELLKPPYVGVPADSAIRLFFSFF